MSNSESLSVSPEVSVRGMAGIELSSKGSVIITFSKLVLPVLVNVIVYVIVSPISEH